MRSALLLVVMLAASLVASCSGCEIHGARLDPIQQHPKVAAWVFAARLSAEFCIYIDSGIEVLALADGAFPRCEIAVGVDRSVVSGVYPILLDMGPDSPWAGAVGSVMWAHARLGYVVPLISVDPQVAAAALSGGRIPLWVRFRHANMLFARSSAWVPVSAGDGILSEESTDLEAAGSGTPRAAREDSRP